MNTTGESPRAVRCLLGMLGVDCHSKGVRTLARLLRDRGVEVIYVGEHNTADALAEAAGAEDADVIGVSFSTSTYRHHSAELIAAMKRAGVSDIPVMIGGLIHADHEDELREIGISAIFGAGTTTEQIMEFLDGIVRPSVGNGSVSGKS